MVRIPLALVFAWPKQGSHTKHKLTCTSNNQPHSINSSAFKTRKISAPRLYFLLSLVPTPFYLVDVAAASFAATVAVVLLPLDRHRIIAPRPSARGAICHPLPSESRSPRAASASETELYFRWTYIHWRWWGLSNSCLDADARRPWHCCCVVWNDIRGYYNLVRVLAKGVDGWDGARGEIGGFRCFIFVFVIVAFGGAYSNPNLTTTCISLLCNIRRCSIAISKHCIIFVPLSIFISP